MYRPIQNSIYNIKKMKSINVTQRPIILLMLISNSLVIYSIFIKEKNINILSKYL